MNLTEQEIRNLQELAGAVNESTSLTPEAEKIAKEIGEFLMHKYMDADGIAQLDPSVPKKIRRLVGGLAEYMATLKTLGAPVKEEKAKNKASVAHDGASKIYDKIEKAISDKNQKAFSDATAELRQFMTASGGALLDSNVTKHLEDIKKRALELKEKAKKAGLKA